MDKALRTGRVRWAGSLAVALVTSMCVVLSGVSLSAVNAAYACGKLFTDPADDAINDPPGDGSNLDNLDIIGGGIAADTATSFTTEIGVKNLSKGVDDSTVSGTRWTFRFTVGETQYASDVQYSTEDDSVTYTWGTMTTTPTGGSLYQVSGDTTGEFKEGENGYVRVVVPIGAEGSPEAGSELTDTFAQTSITRRAPVGPSAGATIDRGPDEGTGTAYKLGSCAGGGGAATSPGVTLKFETLTPKKGSVVRGTAGLKVCKGHSGTTIKLQKKKSGVFKTVAKKKLNSNCKAVFKVTANFRKATFRALWPKQHADHKKGVSKSRTLVTR